MLSTTSPKTGYDDPTQYACLSDTSAKAYSEMPGLAEPDRYPVPEGYPKGQRWSLVVAIAALGLLAAFLLALLTLQMVRANEPGATTPNGVVTESVTTVVPEHPAAPIGSSSSPANKAVTIPAPPPATMTNPLEPPATMTNPLEPPATMTNPLEPPVGEIHTQAE